MNRLRAPFLSWSGRGVARRAALLLALLAGFTLGRAGDLAENLKRYNDDIRLLSTKIAQYRYRLKSSGAGAAQLATLEAQLAKLKAGVEEITRLAGEVEAKDRRIHYLQEMEVGPKGRDFERTTQAQEQRSEQLRQQKAGVDREWAWWATQKHTFKTPDEEAGYQAAWVQYNRIKALDDRYKSDQAEAQREMKEQFDRALQAYTKAQQELSEAETAREKAAAQWQEQVAQYGGDRAPVVEALVALDNAPPPVTVPLTAFPQGVPPSEAGLVARVRQPVGPGTNTHALDQLRIVTSSSRFAAGRDEHDAEVTPPPAMAAVTAGGYQFDTGGGLDPAALPEVAAPPAAPVVPLELPPSLAAQADAPAPVRGSLRLQELAGRQTDNVKKLDELYATRRALFQQGAAASPAELTKVVNDISATHAAIATDVVVEKLAEGSKTIDLTIIHRAPKKPISAIVVPPPDNAATAAPPK